MPMEGLSCISTLRTASRTKACTIEQEPLLGISTPLIRINSASVSEINLTLSFFPNCILQPALKAVHIVIAVPQTCSSNQPANYFSCPCLTVEIRSEVQKGEKSGTGSYGIAAGQFHVLAAWRAWVSP